MAEPIIDNSEYIIPIHGIIGTPDEPLSHEPYFSFDSFLLHINKAKGYSSIALDINSIGGYVDVANKMIDILIATKKPIRSFNTGDVCSAASKLFTLAPAGSRTFDPSKGVFLIHNPWGNVEGDADNMEQAAKALQAMETDYAKWYAEHTGADINVIRAYMKENIPLTSEQVQELGFATVIQPTVKAVAFLNNNSKNEKMDNEVKEKLNGFSALLEKIMAKLKIKAIMITDADGNELEFPELTDANEVKVGVKVTLDGKPAEGEFTQPDGSVLVCVGGLVTEIKPKTTDEVQALKDENAALKVELDSMKAVSQEKEKALSEAVNSVKELQSQFKNFKAQFSDGSPRKASPGNNDDSKRNAGKVSREDVDKALGY